MTLRRDALAAAAGAATVAAFAPIGFFPACLASLALLIHLWIGATPRACLRTGFWFGLGLFGAGVSWVFVSLSRFGGMPWPLAGLATALFCALLALFPALAGWLQARVPARAAVRATLLVPAAWVLAEWLRGWVLTGFPWLAVGYAATGSPLQGLAPVLGVYAVSFAVVSAAGLAWCMARGRRRVPAALALVALLGAGEALRHVEWTMPEGEPISVALLQGNVAQDLKFLPERYARTLETYARLAESTSAQLIVLPETAIPRFLDLVDPAYVARLEAAATRSRGDLLLGVPLRTAPGEYYNAVVSLGASPTQVYRKTHLVPFGEFVPPGLRWVLHVLEIPLSDFSRGPREQAPLEVAGQRVAVNVCYEDAFGEEIARQLPEATLLVNVSNVAWFGDSLAPGQHLQIARMRAIETGRMHLTATNTGVTAVIDRDGAVLARLPQFAEGVLEASAQGRTGATPFVRYGDAPIVLAALLALAAAASVAWRKASR